MPSLSQPIERARPLLGTTVTCRVRGLGPALAHAAIDDAFAAIGHVHACMSFHEPTSDVSRLNRHARFGPVDVDPQTFDVLRLAQRIADASGGAFDITTAPTLVDWDLLPEPTAGRPDSAASWRDIELGPDRQVRFQRPLWIDLGGIAKGHAVDRALECLIAHGAVQASVNAGGDLRVHGPLPERVLLNPDSYRDGIPMIEIENGSIASSDSRAHVDTRRRGRVERGTFVSVAAPVCAVADALTKIVIARGRDAAAVLLRYRAAAHLYSPSQGWQHLGLPA